MLENLHVPKLERIEGTLSLLGQKNVSQENFPKLKFIGGDVHLALSGFTKLPDSIEHIGEDVYVAVQPQSLIDSCIENKKKGIIKGVVFLVGDSVKFCEDGTVEYEAIAPLKSF